MTLEFRVSRRLDVLQKRDFSLLVLDISVGYRDLSAVKKHTHDSTFRDRQGPVDSRSTGGTTEKGRHPREKVSVIPSNKAKTPPHSNLQPASLLTCLPCHRSGDFNADDRHIYARTYAPCEVVKSRPQDREHPLKSTRRWDFLYAE